MIRDSILSASALGFPEPPAKRLHWPTFREPNGEFVEPGYARCLRCEQLIDLLTFVDEECGG